MSDMTVHFMNVLEYKISYIVVLPLKTGLSRFSGLLSILQSKKNDLKIGKTEELFLSIF